MTNLERLQNLVKGLDNNDYMHVRKNSTNFYLISCYQERLPMWREIEKNHNMQEHDYQVGHGAFGKFFAIEISANSFKE